MPVPAPFPSVLKTSGRNLADANGFVLPMLKGLVKQVTSSPASTFTAMAAEGAQIVRTVVFWDMLEPTQGNISASYITTLDAHIANCAAAGMYTVFTFYYGPNGGHCPTWVPGGTSVMSNYVTYGQTATQYLAKRYGDPSDPLGAGKYTKAVTGFGINEITPDSTTGAGWLNTLIGQQCDTMIPWMRAFAPAWIACISCGFGGTAPVPNAAGSGETAQTFTGVDHALLDAAGGNYMLEFHDYLMATTDGTDGRTVQGLGNNNVTIKAHNTAYTSYPPVVGGTALTRATCQADQVKYVAPYKAYCSANSVPLMVGEFGWVPVDSGVTWTGGDLWIADKMAAWGAASPVIETQWDYNTNQVQDGFAARPGAGLPGADANGWQTVSNLFFASPGASGTASQAVTVAVSAAGNTATASGAALPVAAAAAADGNGSTGSITPPGTPYVVGHLASASGSAVTVPVITPLTGGDTLVLCWGTGGATDHVLSVSDTAGNAYTIDNAQITAGRSCGFCYVTSAAALGVTDTIAVSFSTTSAARITAIGIPGVSGIDLAPAGAGGTSASPSAATGTLSQQEEICVGVMAVAGGAAPTGLSWTLVETQGTTGTILAVTYTLPGPSTASQANSGTITSNAWGAAVITFEGVSSGPLTGVALGPVTVASAADGNTGTSSGAALPVAAAAAASGNAAGTASRAVTVTRTAAGNMAAASDASLPVTAATGAAGNVAVAGAAGCLVAVTAPAAGDATAGASQPVTAAPAGAGNIATASGTARPVTAATAAAGTGLGAAARPVTAATAAAGTTAASGTTAQPVTVATAAAGIITSAPGAATLAAAVAAAAAGNMAAASAASLAVTAIPAAAGNVAVASGAAVPVTAIPSAAGNIATASGAADVLTVTDSAAAAGSVIAVSRAVTATLAAAGNIATASGASRPVTAAASAAGTGLGTASLAVTAAPAAAGTMAAASDAASVPVTVTSAAAAAATGTASRAVTVTVSAGGISSVVAFGAPAVLPVAVRLAAGGHGAARKAVSAGAVAGRHTSKATVTAGGPP